MSDPQLPTRTAGEVTLPGGETVWCQTLNTLLRDQAEHEAHRYAAKECRGLLRGGSDYPAVAAQMRAMTPEQQATYLAQKQYYDISQGSQGKFPDPQEPERGDLENDTYTKAMADWEADCKKADAQRKEYEQTRWDAEVALALAMPTKDRIVGCCTVYFSREYSGYYIKRLTVETIYRAVRQNDDHTARYFASVAAVEDADDGVMDAINDFLNGIDTVKPADIPTTPADS